MTDEEEDLGRGRPCYGEFQCSRCRRRWKSTKTWADCGQICSECDNLVSPTNLKKNFAYICHGCNAFWYSFYSQRRKQCVNCKLYEVSNPLDPDDTNDQNIINSHKKDHANEPISTNPNGEHKEDLCQKCQATGRPCREAVDSRHKSRFTPDKYKQRNTVIPPINNDSRTTSNHIIGEHERNRRQQTSFPNSDEEIENCQGYGSAGIQRHYQAFRTYQSTRDSSKTLASEYQHLYPVLMFMTKSAENKFPTTTTIRTTTIATTKTTTATITTTRTTIMTTTITTTTITTTTITTTTITTTTITTTTPGIITTTKSSEIFILSWIKAVIEWIKSLIRKITTVQDRFRSLLSKSAAPCFAENMIVTLKSSAHVLMRDLRVGDQIHVSSGKVSPVVAIFRHQRSYLAFIELQTTSNLSKPLRLTSSHSILTRKPSNGIEQYRFARDVSVGDFVFSAIEQQSIKVTDVRHVFHADEYAYAPLTFEGTIVVNDLIASCYATHSHSNMHIIMTPIRWWYWALIQYQQLYLHGITTGLCERFVDTYLLLFF
ncbi:unnamed protein product [Rotaria magnacalcarata]|uniref:Hint domain-containing protein n=1 Tax=Rotaria magnacalcarata TaxID=392030 RepID=A0A8S2MTW2_9BILA|nr:unnamed protein product [Rotaria magnacalcarata]